MSANFSYAKCSSIHQRVEVSLSDPAHPLMELSCVEPRFETEWTKNVFYIMSTETQGYVADVLLPICMDTNSMIFVKINTGKSTEE